MQYELVACVQADSEDEAIERIIEGLMRGDFVLYENITKEYITSDEIYYKCPRCHDISTAAEWNKITDEILCIKPDDYIVSITEEGEVLDDYYCPCCTHVSYKRDIKKL